MNKFIKDIGLSMLISIIMMVLFEWGYGGVHTASQFVVYSISSFGVYMFVRDIIDVLNGGTQW